MEPLFFKAENENRLLRELVAKPSPSMEPLFFKAENPWAPSGHSIVRASLQWSRFFSKRKILSRRLFFQQRQPPSMEPLFFKAENLA